MRKFDYEVMMKGYEFLLKKTLQSITKARFPCYGHFCGLKGLRLLAQEFEPLGCHPDHRRRGLARAVISEALCRLPEREVREVREVVYTGRANAGARGLYESLGFHGVGKDYDCTKRLILE